MRTRALKNLSSLVHLVSRFVELLEPSWLRAHFPGPSLVSFIKAAGPPSSVLLWSIGLLRFTRLENSPKVVSLKYPFAFFRPSRMFLKNPDQNF